MYEQTKIKLLCCFFLVALGACQANDSNIPSEEASQPLSVTKQDALRDQDRLFSDNYYVGEQESVGLLRARVQSALSGSGIFGETPLCEYFSMRKISKSDAFEFLYSQHELFQERYGHYEELTTMWGNTLHNLSPSRTPFIIDLVHEGIPYSFMHIPPEDENVCGSGGAFIQDFRRFLPYLGESVPGLPDDIEFPCIKLTGTVSTSDYCCHCSMTGGFAKDCSSIPDTCQSVPKCCSDGAKQSLIAKVSDVCDTRIPDGFWKDSTPVSSISLYRRF